VKFKKLAAGGYSRSFNSGARARRKLAMALPDLKEIIAIRGSLGSIGRAPAINHTSLIGPWLWSGRNDKIEGALKAAFDISACVQQLDAGPRILRQDGLGIPLEKLNESVFTNLAAPPWLFQGRPSTRPNAMFAHHDARRRAGS